ncbi:hypothetical protein WR25_26928 [Diploscapter pachys]|uniref:Uncharacterized protein n=1 Tax=Diploscapter pachys TaxID=2018661 RepID=A0A2A2JUX4_9BILA|nr:hypothetical protein WR25_26928 [Diploscapter pachys]
MKRKTPNAAVQTRTRRVRVWDGRDGLLKEGQNSLQGAGGARRPRKRMRGRRRATSDDDRLGLAQRCSSVDRRLLMAGFGCSEKSMKNSLHFTTSPFFPTPKVRPPWN